MSAVHAPSAGIRPVHVHLSRALVVVTAACAVAAVVTAGALLRPVPTIEKPADAATIVGYRDGMIPGEVRMGPGNAAPLILPLVSRAMAPVVGEVRMRPGNADPIIVRPLTTRTSPVAGEVWMGPGLEQPIIGPGR